jgi:hypothetical protein
MGQALAWQHVQTPEGGCSFARCGESLIVRSAAGQRTAPLAGACPETVAREIARELAADAVIA